MFLNYIDSYINLLNEITSNKVSDVKSEIKYDDSKYYIEIELPRVKKTEVKVNFEGDVLNIIVESSALKIKKEYKVLNTISKESIKAKMEDGVLYISLDKHTPTIKEVKIE